MKLLKVFVGLIGAGIIVLLVYNGLKYLGEMLIYNFVEVLDSEAGRNILAINTLVSFIVAVYIGRNAYRSFMLEKKKKL